jgi:hypothetical protein
VGAAEEEEAAVAVITEAAVIMGEEAITVAEAIMAGAEKVTIERDREDKASLEEVINLGGDVVEEEANA